MAELQVEFLLACRQCAKKKRLSNDANKTLKEDNFKDIPQADAADLIDSFISALGLSKDPSFGYAQLCVETANLQEQSLVKVTASEAVGSASCFGFDLIGKNNVAMRDWYDCSVKPFTSKSKWESGDLPPSLRSLHPSGLELVTVNSTIQKVDTKKFKTLRMVMGHTDQQELRDKARDALINNGQELKVPVLDQNNQYQMMVMRLKDVALHACTAASSTSGHYLT